jgi:hypothetical protein
VADATPEGSVRLSIRAVIPISELLVGS